MMGIFGFFKRPQKKSQRLLDEEQKLARSKNIKDRLKLAADERTSQEVLYYLAEKDPSPRVRHRVAQNASTPLQASVLLAKDGYQDVRHAMAQRLLNILPSLDDGSYSHLYAFAVQALGMLALDEVLKIRRALSDVLKDYAKAPPNVAVQLAKDLEREVSEPILRFCMAIPDDDLLEILQEHPANWAAEAVARRSRISARVSRAVLDTGNTRAGAYLIDNKGADVPLAMLEDIVERAKEYPEWHKPIVTRQDLPPLMAQKLAAFVDKSVRKILLARSDYDPQTIDAIAEIIQRRITFERTQKKMKSQVRDIKPYDRARDMFQKGVLTEDAVSDALAVQDNDFVLAALALQCGTNISTIRKVFDVKAPKSICAVCWACGFSMRFALKLQQSLGRIHYQNLIYPRGGVDYPLSEADMLWHLEIIGIKPVRR